MRAQNSPWKRLGRNVAIASSSECNAPIVPNGTTVHHAQRSTAQAQQTLSPTKEGQHPDQLVAASTSWTVIPQWSSIPHSFVRHGWSLPFVLKQTNQVLRSDMRTRRIRSGDSTVSKQGGKLSTQLQASLGVHEHPSIEGTAACHRHLRTAFGDRLMAQSSTSPSVVTKRPSSARSPVEPAYCRPF